MVEMDENENKINISFQDKRIGRVLRLTKNTIFYIFFYSVLILLISTLIIRYDRNQPMYTDLFKMVIEKWNV